MSIALFRNGAHVLLAEPDEALLAEAGRAAPAWSVGEKSPLGVVGRYLLYKEWGEWPLSNVDGSPQPCAGKHWSLSHAGNFVAVAWSQSEVGIDIEVPVPRSDLLWAQWTEAEWQILRTKNWFNFYVLWTAKEALVKKLSCTLDGLPDMCLTGREGLTLYLRFRGEQYTVGVEEQSSYVLALA